MADIFREPTEEEKRDFTPLSKKNVDPITRFTQKVNEVEKRYFEEKKPYCKKCAVADYKEALEFKLKRMSEAERYETDLEQFNVVIPEPEKYGETERFKNLGQRKTLNPANAAKGTKSTMHVSDEYQCKVRGCRIAIFGEQEVEESK